MKKIVFYRLSIIFVICLLFISLIPLSAIYLIIFHKLSAFEYIIAILAILLFGCELIRLIKLRIVLNENYIHANSDGLHLRERVQYETQINYSDISNVDIIQSQNNSLGKKIKKRWISSNVKKTYLRFKLKNGNYNYICVSYYSKKQVSKLLNEISKRILYKTT